jgi:phage terminase large subunit GpA-like protein
MNHALDARIYARAAAFVAGLDRYRDSDWEARALMLGVTSALAGGRAPAADVASAPPTRAAAPAAMSTKRPSWLQPRPGWLGRR